MTSPLQEAAVTERTASYAKNRCDAQFDGLSDDLHLTKGWVRVQAALVDANLPDILVTVYLPIEGGESTFTEIHLTSFAARELGKHLVKITEENHSNC